MMCHRMADPLEGDSVMDNNKIEIVSDGDAAELKTVVAYNHDNSTGRMDIDDGLGAEQAPDSARPVTMLEMLVIAKWSKMKQYFPEDVQNQVDDLLEGS